MQLVVSGVIRPRGSSNGVAAVSHMGQAGWQEIVRAPSHRFLDIPRDFLMMVDSEC